MAKEEIEVELKAKAGNLQQTLEKMQKTLDKLSSGKHEMKLNTNADAIVKSLGNVDKQLKKLSKNNNLNISLSAGDTLARLKNIDDRLKSINKNSKVNLTATTGGTLNTAAQQAEKLNKSLSKIKSKSITVNVNGANEAINRLTKIKSLLNSIKSKSININLNTAGKTRVGSSGVNSSAIKEQYRTLAQEARNYALQAEKAWSIGDTKSFKSYRDAFMVTMNDMANFKRSLGDLSIGNERNIYANMARGIKQNSPLYNDILEKVKALNEEQRKFNASTGKIKVKTAVAPSAAGGEKIGTSTEYANLQNAAISAAKTLNNAKVDSSDAVKAKKDYEKALDALIRFKEAKGSVSYSTLGATYKSIAPKIEKDSSAYKLLQKRIDDTKRATRELNGTQINTKDSSSSVMSTTEKLQYMIRFLGRASKGVGSTGEALSDALGKIDGSAGVFGFAAKGATVLTAGLAVLGVGLYGVYQSATMAFSILQSLGQFLINVLQPGIETYTTTTKSVLSLSAAMQTMGNIGGNTIKPFEAQAAALNLVNQSMYRAQQSAFSYQEVIHGLQGVLPLVLGKGGTAQQALEMTTGVAGVAKLTGLNQNQVLQETRDLLQGTITARTSQVANALGITNAQIEQYKGNTDKLFEYFMQKFSAYSQVLRDYSNTLPGAFEQLKETIGIAGQSVLDQFSPALTALAQTATSMLGTFVDANGRWINSNKEVVDAYGNVIGTIDEAKEAGQGFDETTTSFKPSEGLQEFIDMLIDIAGYIAMCADDVYNWAEANGYIGEQSSIFSTIGDLIKLIIGYTVNATMFLIDFGTAAVHWGILAYNAFLPFINIIRSLINLFGILTKAMMGSLEMGAKALSGDFSGVEATYNEYDKQLKNDFEYYVNMKPLESVDESSFMKQSSKSTRAGGFYDNWMANKNGNGKYKSLADWAKDAIGRGINPSQVLGNKVPDTEAAKKAAKEALRAAKRAYDEQKEALKNALEDIKDSIKKQMESLETMFSQGLLTVTDYYRQKEQLEASQAQADVDYYKQLISLTEQMPYEHEEERNKELLKLGRELAKATSKLDDINKTQYEIVDLTDYNNKLIEQQNVQPTVNKQTAGETSVPLGATPEEAIEYTMSKKYNVPLDLILAVAMQESGNRQWGGAGGKLTTSSAGAQGVMQLMPDTFKSMGFDDISDVNQNVEAGVAYLRQLLDTFNNNTTNVLAGYNAGTGAVQKYGGVPPYAETQDYVSSVLSKMQGEALDRATQLNNSTLQEVADNTSKMTTSADSYDSLLADISKNIYYNNVTSHDQEEQITGLTHETWEKMQLLAKELGGEFNVSAGYDPTGEGHSEGSKHYQGLAFDLAGGSMDDPEMRAKAIAMAPYFGLEAHDEYPGGDWAQYAQGANVHFQNTLPDLPVQTYEKQRSLGSTSLPTVSTKEGLAARNALRKEQEDYLNAVKEFYELIGQGMQQDTELIRFKYDEAIKQYKEKANHATSATVKKQYDELAGMAEVVEKAKIRSTELKYTKQDLEYKLKEFETTSEILAGKLSRSIDGTYNTVLTGEMAVEHYFTNYFGDRSPVKEAMDKLTKIASEEQEIGNIKAYNDTKSVIDSLFSGIQKNIKTFSDRVDDAFSNKISLVEGSTSLTTGQKEQQKNILGAAKAGEQAKINTSEIEGYKDVLSRLGDLYNQKMQEGTESAKQLASVYLQTMQQIQYAILPAIERQKALNEQAAKLPMLLEETRTVAKQSLEDGLLTFLTDGVNEANNLGEAFRNMVVSILKDLQKLFAKKMVLDLFNRWFGSSSEATSNTAPTPSTGSDVKTYPGLATGGIINGPGTETSDSIPTMLSNNEGVITAKRVRQLGTGFIHAVNRGDFSAIYARLPKFANGGVVGEGVQNTARGMATFADTIGTNVSTTNNMSIALVRDENEAMEHFMKNGNGQRIMLDFSKKYAKLTSKFNR